MTQENNSSKDLLKIGDFAKNKIHGYVTFIYGGIVTPYFTIHGIILDISSIEEPWLSDYIKEGYARGELPTELEKITPTLALIAKAKEYLIKMNSSQANMIDNLSYIEMLSKLSDQEKALKK